MSPLVLNVVMAAEVEEPVNHALSWAVGGSAFGILVLLLVALVAFGGGREHS